MSDWQSEALAALEHAREVLANEVAEKITLTPANDLFGGLTPEIDDEDNEFEVIWDAKTGVIPRLATVPVYVHGYGDLEVTCIAAIIDHDTYEDDCRVTYTAVIKTNSSKEG